MVVILQKTCKYHETDMRWISVIERPGFPKFEKEISCAIIIGFLWEFRSS